MVGSRTVVAPAAVLGLAALLRFFHLGEQSVWYDEAVVVLFAQKSLSGMASQIANDTMPPLPYLLLHYWQWLGREEGTMRILSALFSTGSIVLLYGLGQRLFDRRVGLVAALLAAASPFQVYFGQEARMYGQLSFFSLGAAYAFVRAWQGGGRGAWSAFAVASAGAAYTHNLGLLTPLAIDAFALVMIGKKRARLRPWATANAGLALIYAPWLLVLWRQMGMVGQTFWVDRPTVIAIPATLYAFLFAYTLTGPLLAIALFVILLLVALGLYLAARRILTGEVEASRPPSPLPSGRRKGEPLPAADALLLCLIMAFLPVLLTYLVSFYRPLYLDRALIGSSFFLYILLAWTLLRLQPVWLRGILSGVLGVLLLIGLYHYYFVPSFARPPMREAAQSLARELRPGDLVLHTSDGSFLPFVFYDGRERHQLIAGDPALRPGGVRALALSILDLQPRPRDELIAGQEEFWLVVSLDHSLEWQVATRRWFDEHYQLEGEQDFRGIKLYRYRRG